MATLTVLQAIGSYERLSTVRVTVASQHCVPLLPCCTLCSTVSVSSVLASHAKIHCTTASDRRCYSLCNAWLQLLNIPLQIAHGCNKRAYCPITMTLAAEVVSICASPHLSSTFNLTSLLDHMPNPIQCSIGSKRRCDRLCIAWLQLMIRMSAGACCFLLLL